MYIYMYSYIYIQVYIYIYTGIHVYTCIYIYNMIYHISIITHASHLCKLPIKQSPIWEQSLPEIPVETLHLADLPQVQVPPFPTASG